jgi:hypothetical protein
MDDLERALQLVLLGLLIVVAFFVIRWFAE